MEILKLGEDLKAIIEGIKGEDHIQFKITHTDDSFFLKEWLKKRIKAYC